jgi:hypothetical protein
MAGTQRLLAMMMGFSMAGIPGTSNADALGIVVQAERASLGSEAASEGTTIYDGDRLSTGEGGSLRLSVGETLLSLQDQSIVIVHSGAGGMAKEFEAELVMGTAALSVPAASSAEIVASLARVRPTGETRGVVQVRRVGPHELLVFAQRGPAEISYRGESETIAEGKSYRVLLNASEDGASGDEAPRKAGKPRKALLLIAVAAGAAAIIIPTVMAGPGRGLESPDRP